MLPDESERIGVLVEYEADKNYCREVVKIAKGQNLKVGSVISKNSDGTCIGTSPPVSKITSRYGRGDGGSTGGTTGETSGETSGSTDDFANVLGILIEDVNATEEEKPGIIISRDAIVNQSAIIFPSGITDANKKLLMPH